MFEHALFSLDLFDFSILLKRVYSTYKSKQPTKFNQVLHKTKHIKKLEFHEMNQPKILTTKHTKPPPPPPPGEILRQNTILQTHLVQKGPKNYRLTIDYD